MWKCGGRLDLPDAPTNETVLSCKNCGAPWDLVEVKHDMKRHGRSHIAPSRNREEIAAARLSHRPATRPRWFNLRYWCPHRDLSQLPDRARGHEAERALPASVAPAGEVQRDGSTSPSLPVLRAGVAIRIVPVSPLIAKSNKTVDSQGGSAEAVTGDYHRAATRALLAPRVGRDHEEPWFVARRSFAAALRLSGAGWPAVWGGPF